MLRSHECCLVLFSPWYIKPGDFSHPSDLTSGLEAIFLSIAAIVKFFRTISVLGKYEEVFPFYNHHKFPLFSIMLRDNVFFISDVRVTPFILGLFYRLVLATNFQTGLDRTFLGSNTICVLEGRIYSWKSKTYEEILKWCWESNAGSFDCQVIALVSQLSPPLLLLILILFLNITFVRTIFISALYYFVLSLFLIICILCILISYIY